MTRNNGLPVVGGRMTRRGRIRRPRETSRAATPRTSPLHAQPSLKNYLGIIPTTTLRLGRYSYIHVASPFTTMPVYSILYYVAVLATTKRLVAMCIYTYNLHDIPTIYHTLYYYYYILYMGNICVIGAPVNRLIIGRATD